MKTDISQPLLFHSKTLTPAKLFYQSNGSAKSKNYCFRFLVLFLAYSTTTKYRELSDERKSSNFGKNTN